ncbi:hypothetical protein GCK32_012012, partial [Trichostrongylus colubriformis]
ELKERVQSPSNSCGFMAAKVMPKTIFELREHIPRLGREYVQKKEFKLHVHERQL